MRRAKGHSPHPGEDQITIMPGNRNKLHRVILDTAPDAILLVDEHGTIVLHNKATETMFGYGAAELKALSVEDLLPESLATLHRGYRKGYARDPVVRKMGSGLDLRGRRKDGLEFRVDIMLSPLMVGSQLHVVAVIRDDSVRHREREALEELLHTLQSERAKVQTLKSLLPICAWCKKIRDDDGYWTKLEEYFHDHADVDFTHGICPDCTRKVEERRHGVAAAESGTGKKSRGK